MSVREQIEEGLSILDQYGLSLQDYRLAMLRMAGDVVEFAKLAGLEEAS